MNVIETNYLPKLNIRETQEALNLIDKKLRDEIEEKLEVFFIRQPVVSSERISTNLSSFNGQRQINFDGSNDNSVYYVYNTYKYWLLKSLETMEVKNNSAVAMIASYIDRDVEIKNTQSMEKRVVEIEYRYDNKKGALAKAMELNEIFISIFREVEKEVISRFKTIRPSFPHTIVEKKINRISKKTNLDQALADIGADEKVYTLVNVRPASSKSIYNTFEVSLKAYSKIINESYDLMKIQDRRTVMDLEPETAESESTMEEYIFAKEILDNLDLRTINIEIDLDSLAMCILGKAHILEIQSGKNITEIEKILSGADIKHL